MPNHSHHFKLGAFDCIALDDGSHPAPLSDIVAGAPPAELEAAAQAAGLPTTSPVGYNVLLVNTGQQTILIDAGQGPDGQLMAALEAESIAAGDIDVLVITHADGDHVGGLVSDGQLVFARARYVMWQGAMDLWSGENALGEIPDNRADYVQGTLPLIRDRLDTVAEGEEFLPGFTAVYGRGHRPDHFCLWISSEGQQLLHAADAILHALTITNPDWYSTYDELPEEAVTTKRKLLVRATTEQALVFCAHLPFPGLGHVVGAGDGWAWQPLEA